MAATLYESIAYIGGFLYLQLYLWIIFPQIFETLAGVFGGMEPLEGERLSGYRSLLTMVAPIGFIYIGAAWNKLTTLIDLTIVWRLLWVGPWIVLSMKSGEPLEKSAAMVIAGLDIGLPVMALLLCPTERAGLVDRLKTHFSMTSETYSQVVLMWTSRIGFILSAGLAINAFLMEEQTYLQSFSLAVAGCYHLMYDYFARWNNNYALRFSIWLQMVLNVTFCLMRFVYDYSRPFSVEAMMVYAFVASSCYIYTIAWDAYVETDKCSYGLWGGAVGFLVIVVSLFWTMCAPLFVPNAQVISINQHRFDILLSTYVALVCYVMEDLKKKVAFHAKLITWLVPWFLIWYSTEVKLVINLNLGSPYHPSWMAKGLTDAMYSDQFVIDFSYGLIATLMTFVATTYGSIITIIYFEPTGWRRLSWNGVLNIWVSAYFMLATSSGIPSFTEGGIPPAIPPIYPLNFIDLVDTHVRDIIMGLTSILAGLALDGMKVSHKKTAFVKYLVALSWVLLVLPKVYLFFDFKMV